MRNLEVHHSMTDAFTEATSQSLRFHLGAKGRSDLTFVQYREDFLRFYEWLGGGEDAALRAVTRKDIERYMSELRRTDGGELAPATRRHHFAGLRGFFKWYAEVEGIPSPMLGMTGPQVPETSKDIVSVGQVRNALLWLDRRQQYRNAALVSLLFETGMRVSEACGLRWDAIDFRGQVVNLAKTKNGTVRTPPFESATARRLDLWNRRRPDKVVPWVFPGRQGNHLTRHGVLYVVTQVFREHGLDHISPHDLRHSMATAFMDENPDGEATLMAVGGWNSVAMVRHYAKQGRDKRAIEDFRKRSPTGRL